jgi:hypothetical protein
MKKNIFKMFIALIAATTFSSYTVHAQTYGAGNLGGAGCVATSILGNCSDTYVGSAAGATNTGWYNTFYGDSAGYNNTSARDDIAIGLQALYTQSYATAIGTFNAYNIAIGDKALYTNNPTSSTNGWRNTAIGHLSLYSNTTASNNTALGFSAGYNNTTGGNNNFIGWNCGYTNTTGTANSFLGTTAGYSNSTGSYNTFFGNASGYNNTASDNTFTGYAAGYSNTTGTANAYFGYQAGGYNSTGGYNTVMGYQAGLGVSGTSTYTDNTFIGQISGTSCTTGSYNVFLGEGTGNSVTTASNNTFIGDYAGSAATTGGNNIAIGASASGVTTGQHNVIIGEGSGGNVTTNSDNTCLGDESNVGATTYSNSTAVGYKATTNASNQVFLGNSSVTTLYCFGANASVGVAGTPLVVDATTGQIGFGTSSKRYKKDIVPLEINTSLLYNLRPVSFTYLKDNSRSFGLIAEEVDKVIPELVFYRKAKDVIQGSTSEEMVPEGVRYESLPTLLLAELQKQHAQLEEQKQVITDLKVKSTKVDSLESQLKQIQSLVNESISTGKLSGVQDETGTTLQVQLANNVVLYQNEPNPFGESTVIRYYIPDNLSGDAFIVFYDAFGKEIKKTEITSKGKGQINTDTQNLTSGIYSYSLVIDGVVKDTKKMVKE